MPTSYTNEEKKDSTYTNEGLSTPPARYGKGKFGKSRYGNVSSSAPWTNEEKKSSNYTNEEKQ